MFFLIISIFTCVQYLSWAQTVRQVVNANYHGRNLQFVLMNRDFKHNWYEAMAYCAHQNMDLVTIDSADKNSFIMKNLIPKPIEIQKFWIGLKSDIPETLNELEVSQRYPQNLYWVANNKASSPGYTNWCLYSKQPKPSGPDTWFDMCAGIPTNENCWNSYDCAFEKNRGLSWICEDRLPKKTLSKFANSVENLELNGHKYVFHSLIHLSWKEAEDRCRDNYQKLVTIDNEDELQFIKQEVKKRRLNYWIGLSATVTNENKQTIEWRWNTNSGTNFFRNWCAPDRTNGGPKDHCAFIQANEQCWQNWACSNEDGLADGIICEEK